MSYRPAESGMFTPTSMLTTAPDDTGEGFSVIDRHSNFDGTFVAKRDLRIEGEVKGAIDCSGTLFIAQGANVNARVEAENITVAGEFTGIRVLRRRSRRINPRAARRLSLVRSGERGR